MPLSRWLLLHFEFRASSLEGVQEGRKVEEQRASWRAQKAAQRLRKPKVSLPPAPTEDFVQLVFAERDHRLKREYGMWQHPELSTHAYRHAMLLLAADVWVAQTVLEEQFGPGKAKPKRILDWLVARGLTHGCKPNSLRTMIWRAREKLKCIENEPYLYDRTQVVWPPFCIEEALTRAAR